MRLHTMMMAAVLVAATAAPAEAQAPARRKLTFFAYDGAAAEMVHEVSTQVRWKVMRTARPADLLYIEEKVVQQKLPPAANRLTFWRDSQSLVLAGGQVVRQHTADEFRNEVFLGELGRDLPEELFVAFLFEPSKFASTKDALSAAALYAVGMERVQRGDRSRETRDLFAKALTLIGDIKQRGDGADDVKVLREVIEKQWRSLR